MENGQAISLPEGADLVITEEMRGLNEYECTALNEPQGQEKRATRPIKFHVGKGNFYFILIIHSRIYFKIPVKSGNV